MSFDGQLRSFLQGYMSRIRIARSQGSLCLNLLETAKQFSKMFGPFTLPPIISESSSYSTLSSILVYLFFFPIFFFFNVVIYLFGCIGSSLLHTGFSQLWQAGANLHCGAQASHCSRFLLHSTGSRHAGFSSCGTQAQQLWLAGSRAQAQQLWHTGLVAPQHVGSSQTGAQTHVPCIGRQILNHCATREVLYLSIFLILVILGCYVVISH